MPTAVPRSPVRRGAAGVLTAALGAALVLSGGAPAAAVFASPDPTVTAEPAAESTAQGTEGAAPATTPAVALPAEVVSIVADAPVMYPQRWGTRVGLTVVTRGVVGGRLPVTLGPVTGEVEWVSGDESAGTFRGVVDVPDPGTSNGAPRLGERWDAVIWSPHAEVADVVRWERVENDTSAAPACEPSRELAVGETDGTGPCMVSFDVSPRTAPAGTPVVLTARITDETGLQSPPTVFLYPPNGGNPTYVQLQRVGGSQRDGTYRGSVALPAAPLGRWFLESTAYDSSDNYMRAGILPPFPNTVTTTAPTSASLAGAQLTLTGPTVPLTIGETMALRGVVRTSSGAPVALAAIDVYGRRDAVGTAFVKLATARTDSAGAWSITRGLSDRTIYQARLGSVRSPSLTVVPRLRVNRAAPSTGRTVLNPVTVRGTLTPGLAGLNVALDVRTPAGWQQLAVVRSGTGGAWSVRKALPFGNKTYRLRTSRTPRLLGGLQTFTLNVVKVLPPPPPPPLPAFVAPRVAVSDWLCIDRGAVDGWFHRYEVNVTYTLIGGSAVKDVLSAGFAERVIYQPVGRRVFATSSLTSSPDTWWSTRGSSLLVVDAYGRRQEVPLPPYEQSFAAC